MFGLQNFGISVVQDGFLLQTSRGFFEVYDKNVCNIISELPCPGLISESNLRSIFKKHIMVAEHDDVLSYFIEVLGIVFKTDLLPSTLLVLSSSDRLLQVARSIGFKISDLNVSPNADVIVLLFDGSPDEEVVQAFIKDHPKGSRIIVGFQARDNYVISSVWTEGTGLPCPMCAIDFAHDRVFYDPKDTFMGLSDVYDMVRSLKAKEPHIPMGNADIAFILRHVKQYTDSLTCVGFGGFKPFDPLMASVVDFIGLDRQLIRVPLSPLCNCVNQSSGRE